MLVRPGPVLSSVTFAAVRGRKVDGQMWWCSSAIRHPDVHCCRHSRLLRLSGMC